MSDRCRWEGFTCKKKPSAGHHPRALRPWGPSWRLAAYPRALVLGDLMASLQGPYPKDVRP